jgi:hypothetical protein
MGMCCWDVDRAKRPAIDHALDTLKIAAEQWRPKHEGLSPSPLQNDLPPTVSEGGSSHRSETPTPAPGIQDPTLDTATSANEGTDGQSRGKLGPSPAKTIPPVGQQMDVKDQPHPEPAPVYPRPTKYGVCWGTPDVYDPMALYR